MPGRSMCRLLHEFRHSRAASGRRRGSVVTGALLSGGPWDLVPAFHVCPPFHQSTHAAPQATCVVTFGDHGAFCLFLTFCFVDVISQIQEILY